MNTPDHYTTAVTKLTGLKATLGEMRDFFAPAPGEDPDEPHNFWSFRRYAAAAAHAAAAIKALDAGDWLEARHRALAILPEEAASHGEKSVAIKTGVYIALAAIEALIGEWADFLDSEAADCSE